MKTNSPAYKGRIIDIYKESVRLPNGSTVTMDIVRHPGAAAVVPILDNGNFVLIRQYRHAVGGFIVEIPAGKLDDKEDPAECAKRELMEEAGYSAGYLEKIATVHTTPGFSDEVIHIFLAKNLSKGKSAHEKDEVIETIEVSQKELIRMLDNGEITDAKTLVGIYAALRNQGDEKR